MSTHDSGHAAGQPRSDCVPSADAIRGQLDRILSSPDLQASDRRRTFLRYIVEEALAGRADRLKGYSIALAVFGRDESFDSQTDPVVRLEARRLRRDLDSYYVDAGSSDPIRITIPKGSYAPHFERMAEARQNGIDHSTRPDPLDHAGTGRADAIHRFPVPFRTVILAALMLLAVVAAAWVLLHPPRDAASSTSGDTAGGPSVVVIPFEAFGSAESVRYLASGISEELITNLMRFPGFRLFTLPAGFDGDTGGDPGRFALNLGVAYVVTGSAHIDRDIRVATRLTDAATGEVIWTGSYARPLTPEDVFRVQSDLAGEIATALGQPYGVVNTDIQSRQAAPETSSLRSYVCVLRAYEYRRTFSRDDYPDVLDCLEAAVRRDPGYSDAWAMLGWLHLDAGRFEYPAGRTLDEEYRVALEAASTAVELAPDNTLALKALASISHYMGRFEDGERLSRRAAELNPHDPDTLAQLGWRLAVRGNFEEGIPILRRAIERSANPPGWYFHLVAIDLYLKGDYAAMQDVAERSAVTGAGISEALVAIAAGALGEPDAARAALERMSGYGPIARDPAAYFRRHGATDEIVAALMSGLDKAAAITWAQN